MTDTLTIKGPFDITSNGNTTLIQQKRNSHLANVRDYGAKGDGVSNDTLSFLSAIAVLKSEGGGVLYIPAGKYKLYKSTNGYAVGQYETTTNYALGIDFSNILIQGDGIGLTILLAATVSTTILYIITPDLNNITIKDITFEQPDAASDYANTKTAFVLKGLDPLKATNFIDQGWTLASMVYISGTPNHYINNVYINGCDFKNPVRHGLCFGWVKNVRITDNYIHYYDGFKSPESSGNAVGAGRCGIFSGDAPIHDVLVSGNNFNGNVTNLAPIGSSQTGYAYVAADGFIWFSKGGNINIENNTIRNYGLEAIQIEAAPASIKNNKYVTSVGTPSAVACLAFPHSPLITDIDTPVYEFSGNTVIGDGMGCGFRMVGPTWAYDGNLPTPRGRAIVNGNVFENVDTAVNVFSADSLVCSNNIATNIIKFFFYMFEPYDITFPKLDFRNKFSSFTGNVINGCSDIPFIFNSTMMNNGAIIIKGNIATRGNYHLVLAYPRDKETYSVSLKDNLWINPDGTDGNTPLIAYTPLPSSIKFF